jgi:tRNA threonylcarbamoyl adenosine modification protein YeaZ
MLASGSPVSMRVLALDSASPSPAVAFLAADGDDVAEPLPPNAAESLVARLSALALRCGLDPRAVDRVAVLAGPGSFTGLRAGAAFARGFARALGVPLLSFPTFTAVSAALPEPSDVDFLLDAGRGDVHRARRRGTTLTEDPAPISREAALSEAATDGVPVRDLAESPVLLAPALARLAARAGVPAGGPMRPLRPLYGRPSAAEEKLPQAPAR